MTRIATCALSSLLSPLLDSGLPWASGRLSWEVGDFPGDAARALAASTPPVGTLPVYYLLPVLPGTPPCTTLYCPVLPAGGAVCVHVEGVLGAVLALCPL